MVVQYAKHVIGASKVVAISGSDEKAAWVEKLGADVSLSDLCISVHRRNADLLMKKLQELGIQEAA